MAKPVRVRIYYEIDEIIRERGDYLVGHQTIEGHRSYIYKSGLWLTWKLPRSKQKLLQTIKRWKWKSPYIDYDQAKVDLERRSQDHFEDYNLDNKKITKYDKFHGAESTIVSQIKNNDGPSEIKIFFDNGQELDVKVSSREETLLKVKKIIENGN